MNYKDMYLKLMRAQLDAIKELEALTETLKQAHQEAEELYLAQGNEE